MKLIAKIAAHSLFALSVTTLAMGCASEGDEPAATDEGALSEGNADPALFRNDFFTYLERERYSEDDIRQLVLMPTDAALHPAGVSARSPLAAYDNAFKSLTPTSFYNQGRATQFARKVAPDGPLENELKSRPVHIVVVPGIFGEFISVSPFEEVFAAGGKAASTWEQKLRTAEQNPSNSELVSDRQYSSSALRDVRRSMRDLVRVGSIDDANGTPLVTVTYLKPELGSLETFGTQDENASYYLTRLQKYFQIAGLPEHLYLMGYSRGAGVALNLVTRAEQAHAPWMAKLKGVVSLAGVLYGSQLADDALVNPGPQKELFDATIDFVDNKLESCAGELPEPLLRTRNLGKWTAYLAQAGGLNAQMPKRDQDLAREGIFTGLADAASITSFTQRVLFGDPLHVRSDDTSAMSGVLQVGSPGEYCRNVERFKITARQLVKGVQTLTTQGRVEWWQTHVLPTNISYYAITGTMGDATPDGQRVSPLAVNTTAYDTRSLDFRALRSSYYDLFTATQTQLNDSQVTVARARFWPDLLTTMNPAQRPVKTHFMGTVGIHHWGLSFPRAFSTLDGLEANPFPRKIFLQSIATFVAQTERTGG